MNSILRFSIYLFFLGIGYLGFAQTYCTPSFTQSTNQHMTNVRLTTYGPEVNHVNLTSGAGLTNGYSDYTSTFVEIRANVEYQLKITLRPGNVANDEYTYAGIDYNQDGDFNDPGEIVFAHGPVRDDNYEDRLFTTPNLAPGNYRLRIITKRGSIPTSCEINSDTNQPGEVEDYNLTVVDYQSEIDIESNSVIIADGDTTPSIADNTDFGSLDIFSGSISRTYTIYNRGNTDLFLSGTPFINLTGDAQFSILAQPTSGTIAPNNSLTFTISFSPTAATTYNAQVSIANNDSDENPYTFSITGDGSQNFTDTDGDGVANNVDIDDDNDGIRDSEEQNLCSLVPSASVVTTTFLNETFGTGAYPSVGQINTNNPNVFTTYEWEDTFFGSGQGLFDGKYTVTNTVQFNNASFYDEYWHLGGDHTGDTNGRMAAFNATETPGEIFYQTVIVGVIPGVNIDYSFWVLNLDRFDAPCINGCPTSPNVNERTPRNRPSIRVEFTDGNGNTVIFRTDTTYPGGIPPNSPTVDWIQFAQSFQSTTSSFTVTFYNDELGGLGNDVALDDILITQDLCDVDRDGVADVIDIDNDNDGIPNVHEIGLPVGYTFSMVDPDNDATTFNSNNLSSTEWKDTNGNGMHDDYESLTPRDTDGDGIPDYLDLDSDNDGIFDVLENDGFGDLDVDGDGRGEGDDAEDGTLNDGKDGDGFLSGRLSTDIGDDGILTDFDNNDEDANGGSDDHGTTSYNVPKDTDGDGIPDYIDLYSNDATDSDPLKRDILNSYYAYLDNGSGFISSTADVDRDGINDTDADFNLSLYGAPINLNDSYTIDFDGRNDYIEYDQPLLNNKDSFTAMAWVLLEKAPVTGERVQVMADGSFEFDIADDLRVRARVPSSTGSNQAISTNASFALTLNKWYHISVIFDSPNELLSLFINGVLANSKPIEPSPSGTNSENFRIGRRAGNPNAADQRYFDGSIDEVRIFDSALDLTDMRRIIYQEIDQNGTVVRGKFLPKDISSIPYANLLTYMTFSEFEFDGAFEKSLTTHTPKMYNIKSIIPQSAPLPYVTKQDGDLNEPTTYLYEDVWSPADLTATDYSIVHVKHDVTQKTNYNMVGLKIDAGKTMTVGYEDMMGMQQDYSLTNNWQLLLDGDLDLTGDSQLLQTAESTVANPGTGNLLRRRFGTVDAYGYNYLSSPVATVDIDTDPHILLGDMIDAEADANVIFTASKTPSITAPITISSNWLHTFTNGLSYDDWTDIDPYSTKIYPGMGWSQKGPAPSVNIAEYLFKGNPNNGVITVAAVDTDLDPTVNNVTTLLGNPYPSALDARKFIEDNIDQTVPANSIIDGTLYFWEQFRSTNHILNYYEGGYATVNLMATVKATQYSGLGQLDPTNASEAFASEPKNFIPVGQGFYVTIVSDGDIVFNNDQRVFKQESLNESVFFAAPGSIKPQEDRSSYQDTSLALIRLDFKASDGAARELVIAFDEKFTEQHKYGYDSYIAGLLNPSDLYIPFNEEKYNIRALPAITPDQQVDLTINAIKGVSYVIGIKEFQKFPNEQSIYLWDKKLGAYHDLKNGAYEYTVNATGTLDDRFAITLTKSTLGVDDEISMTNTSIYENSQADKLFLKTTDDTIHQVVVYDLLGKELFRFRESELKQLTNGFDVSSVATGIYLAVVDNALGASTIKFTIE